MDTAALKDFDIRVIVAGTRKYNDVASFSKHIETFILNHPDSKIAFISGAAKSGADALIINWCKEHGYKCFEYPAKWKRPDGTVDMSAGYTRNRTMGDVGTHLIAFWDGVSNGTQNMIEIAEAKKMHVIIHLIKMDNFTFFYGADSCLSQWHRSKFVVKGIEFNCCEQFMMYCKAMLFGDTETADAIMATDDPYEQKRLGRSVKNFDDDVWKLVGEKYVYIGNLNKFKQNKEMKNYLLSTNNTEIVEASGTDRIWGIGLSLNDPNLRDRSKWKGTNKLGKILMRVRDTLTK